MHEVNAVRAAIRNAIVERDAALTAQGITAAHAAESGAFRHLELEIMDPTRATPEAIQLFAPPILEELGLGRVSFDVFVRAVKCAMCGRMTHAEPADPICHACGAPVPRTDGAAIAAQWTKPIPIAAGDAPAHDAGSHLADHQRRKHVSRVVP